MKNKKCFISVDIINHLSLLNPILELGEVVYDITNKKVKIGDGRTDFNRLPYVNQYNDSELHGLISNINDILYQKADKDELEAAKIILNDLEQSMGSISSDVLEQVKAYIDEKILDLSIGTIELETYAKKEDLNQYVKNTELENYSTNDVLDDKLSLKQDKEEGKSLVSDDLIEKLELLENYDDSSLRKLIDLKVDATEYSDHLYEENKEHAMLSKQIANGDELNAKALQQAISEYSMDEIKDLYNDVLKYISYDRHDTIPESFHNGRFDLGSAWSSIQALENIIGQYQQRDEEFGNEIAQMLSLYALKTSVPTKVSQLDNDMGYLIKHQSLDEYAHKSEIPTNVSELVNDKKYVSEENLDNYVSKTEIQELKNRIEGIETALLNMDKSINELRNYIETFHIASGDGTMILNKDLSGNVEYNNGTVSISELEVVSDDNGNVVVK